MAEHIKQWWVAYLMGALATGVGLLFKQWGAQRRALRALLRNQIIDAYNKCERDGCCPIYRLEAIEDMYAQYHALGGNGAITELVDRIKDMPTHNEKIKEN